MFYHVYRRKIKQFDINIALKVLIFKKGLYQHLQFFLQATKFHVNTAALECTPLL